MGISVVEDHYRIERVLLSHPEGATIADLVELTGIPKQTLRNHLATMLEHGRAERLDAFAWAPTTQWIMAILREAAQDADQLRSRASRAGVTPLSHNPEATPCHNAHRAPDPSDPA